MGSDATSGVLWIRDADPREFVLKVSVRPLQQYEINKLDRADARGAATVPDDWRSIQSDAAATWELFNCRVESVKLKLA